MQQGDQVAGFLDKVPTELDVQIAYTGLGYIKSDDLGCFWSGITDGITRLGELQVTPGLLRVVEHSQLHAEVVQWTDVGDEEAYRHAVEEFSGYDWVKTGQVTYVLPTTGRVVKFAEDPDVIRRRHERSHALNGMVPKTEWQGRQFIAYDFVPGVTAYEAVENPGMRGPAAVTEGILKWWQEHVWSTRKPTSPQHRIAANEFYASKTKQRIEMLRPDLRARASEAVARIDMWQLAMDVVPGTFHGDFNFGNIIATPGGFMGIDWREDFAGHTEFGDLRYDLGKLLAGTLIHWGNARRGDFRVWTDSIYHYDAIMRFAYELGLDRHDLMVIGALSLINSAPLHASPLDEIAVTRACRWLERM